MRSRVESLRGMNRDGLLLENLADELEELLEEGLVLNPHMLSNEGPNLGVVEDHELIHLIRGQKHQEAIA